jgi:hypothetical protein
MLAISGTNALACRISVEVGNMASRPLVSRAARTRYALFRRRNPPRSSLGTFARSDIRLWARGLEFLYRTIFQGLSRDPANSRRFERRAAREFAIGRGVPQSDGRPLRQSTLPDAASGKADTICEWEALSLRHIVPSVPNCFPMGRSRGSEESRPAEGSRGNSSDQKGCRKNTWHEPVLDASSQARF